MLNTQKHITFVSLNHLYYKLKLVNLMTKKEKQKLEREIEKLKKDLDDYLRVVPILGVTEKERERVIDQYLDDILNRKKRLEKE